MDLLSSGQQDLRSLANRIARETMEVWEARVRQGQEPIVESRQHSFSSVKSLQRSFSALANVDDLVGDLSLTEYLIDLLQDEDETVRRAATRALGEVDIGSPDVLEALISRLEDDVSWGVRVAAVESLGQIGASSQAVVEALIGRLKNDEQVRVRRSAAEALGQIATLDQALDPLADQQDEESKAVRWAVDNALERMTPNGAAEDFLPLLEDDDPHERMSGVVALKWVAPTDPETTIFLLERLTKDEHWRVRTSAANSLGRIGGDDPEVIEALVDRLDDGHEEVRVSAAEALGHIGTPDPAVLEALVGKLEDRVPRVRAAAARAFGLIGISDPAVRETLLSQLGDQAAQVRLAISIALRQIGTDDPAVIEALIERLSDNNEDVRRAAARALGQIGTSNLAVLDALAERLNDEDEDILVRRRSAEALAMIGSSDLEAVEVLAERLGFENPKVRRQATHAISQQLPWHVFSEAQAGEAIRGFVKANPDRLKGRAVARIEDGKHLLVHWQALARLPE
jgi:HEAT repeat protein